MIRNASATTTTMMSSSRLEMSSPKSICAAVVPVTYAVAADPETADGRMLFFRLLNTSLVAESCGEVVGMAVETRMSPSPTGCGGLTLAVPGTFVRDDWSVLASAGRRAGGTAACAEAVVGGPLGTG